MTGKGPDFTHAPFLKLINSIGSAAFAFLIPVLSGYIAFGIADRPGLVPGEFAPVQNLFKRPAYVHLAIPLAGHYAHMSLAPPGR